MSEIKKLLELKWFRIGAVMYIVSVFLFVISLVIEIPASIVRITINLPIIGISPVYVVILLAALFIGCVFMAVGAVTNFLSNTSQNVNITDKTNDSSPEEATVEYQSPIDEDGHCNDDILNRMSDNELLVWLSKNPSVVSRIIEKNSLNNGKRELFTASPTQIKNWIRNLSSPESAPTEKTKGGQQKADQIPTWGQLNPAPDIEQALLKGNPTTSTILAKMSRVQAKNPQLEARVFQVANVKSWTKLSQLAPQKVARIIAHCANEQNYQ